MGLASEYPAQITNVQLKQTFIIVGSHYWGLTCTDFFKDPTTHVRCVHLRLILQLLL